MNSVTQPSIMSRPGAAILLAGLLFLVGGLRVAAQSQPQQLLPDLIVEQITVEPPNPAAGDTVTVTVTIKNQGEAVAGLFAYHLYIEPPTDPPTITTTHTSSGVYGLGLPAGHQIEFSRTGHTLTGDDPVIWAWVDRDGQVAESEEGNNLLRWPTQTVPDAFEDDDLCTAAQPIPTDGTPQERNLHRDPDADLDWVSFTVTGGVTYRLAATAIGADADLELRLYTTCTGQPTLGAGAELSFTAPASGVYFARLSHTASDYGPDTAYRFTVTGQEQCAQYFEPNDACTLAGDLGVGGEAQTHSFCRPNDVDWLRIEVEAGAEYRARATNLGADADAQLGVYQGCQGDTFTEIGAEVEFTALSSGYVYLKTENREPDHYGESATYSVSVTLQSAPGCVADAHEQDDDQSTARPLTVNRGVQTHNTCPAGEQDWVRFETTPGGVYFIQTLNLAEGADTFLCLHSADGIQLRCDDDSGNGLASRLRFTAVDGVYFASVRDYHRTVAGPATQYDLRVTTESCIPDDLEPDNGANNARPIPTDGSRQAHTTCPAGDEDWVTFVAQPGEYTIESVDLGPEADTVIELYDASGNLLAENDDYGPGLASQIVQTLARPGAYYVRVRHYNSTRYGDGTEYSLRVSRGAPPPTPTPTATPSPTPSPTPTATPPASTDARTLILYHQARMAELYDQAAATNLASELATFAGHSQVQGELIRLDNHPAVANAYAAWAGQPNSPTQANAVTTAIRGVVWTYLQQHDGIETVVIVGDDRVIPFRRVPDRTGRETERTYTGVDASHPTGAALRSDYFLTDDFYVDQTPVVQNGVEIYIPDLAIGRLIETPADIIGQLQQFQTDSTLDGSEVLVTGYDFVDDSAQLMCDDWQTDLGEARVDCALIGQSWSVAEFRTRQLAAASRYQIQSINGHANHFFQGAPTGGIGAGEIVGSSSDLAGGLVYTVGCHAGLNVPATNAIEPLDLPEAFARKRVNYVANTGYGWGYRGAVGLSEQVMLLFTRSLLSGPQRSMGAALVEAKQAYFAQTHPFDPYAEKVMQQVIFYGLPMTLVQSGGALSDPEEFPGVVVDRPLSGGQGEVFTNTLQIDFTRALADHTTVETLSDGQFLALAGHTLALPNQPIQPLYYLDVALGDAAVRGAIVRSAAYTTTNDFDPVIATPYNEYVTTTVESQLPALSAWYPPLPAAVQAQEDRANLVSQLGAYNPAEQSFRLYNQLEVELFYSSQADLSQPDIRWVDSLHFTGTIQVKVEATDPAGVQAVVVSYFPTATQAEARLETVDLQYNEASHKWVGAFPGDITVRYFVQVVDGAGNISTAINKGHYYTPGPAAPPPLPPPLQALFLPLVQR